MDGQKHAHLFSFSGANKAGMADVDKVKQAQVIYELSKNSEYFKHASFQDEKVEIKVKAMLETIKQLTETQIDALKVKSLKRMVELETKRNFDRICCVLDMDMFFAAVEIRDKPELKDLPVAVGGMGMISTANYVARKFGVRSAMPGFIGKKLCPNLVFVAPNFEKYEEAGGIVRKIIAEYDPNFRSLSLDEVYMDLTAASLRRVESHPVGSYSSISTELLRNAAIAILQEIREKVTTQTRGLTCSAGIANNFMLAKICADVNKPNGQFILSPLRSSILDFVSALPTRKIGGIGKVTERMLSSLGMSTMEDVRDQLYKILYCFSPAMSEFLSRACLGIADDEGAERSDQAAAPAGAVMRKSMGAERTFAAMSEVVDLKKKLHELCEILSQDLRISGLSGQTITLKLKTTKFELITRSATSAKYLKECNEIENVASKLLDAALPISIRLMGVSVSKFQGGFDPSRPSAGRPHNAKSIESFFQPKVGVISPIGCAAADNSNPRFRIDGNCGKSGYVSSTSSSSSTGTTGSTLSASMDQKSLAPKSPPPFLTAVTLTERTVFEAESSKFSAQCSSIAHRSTSTSSTSARSDACTGGREVYQSYEEMGEPISEYHDWQTYCVQDFAGDEDSFPSIAQLSAENLESPLSHASCKYSSETTEAALYTNYDNIGTTSHSSVKEKSLSRLIRDKTEDVVCTVSIDSLGNQSSNAMAPSILNLGCSQSTRLISDKMEFTCPICTKSITGTIVALNLHVDKCLTTSRAREGAPADFFELLKSSGQLTHGSNCTGASKMKRRTPIASVQFATKKRRK